MDICREWKANAPPISLLHAPSHQFCLTLFGRAQDWEPWRFFGGDDGEEGADARACKDFALSSAEGQELAALRERAVKLVKVQAGAARRRGLMDPGAK